MIYFVLALFGAAMGSFVGALVWRLHENKNFVSERSECERCHHVLGPLDLIPIFSWIVLRGRCRYCRHRIGTLPIILEISMAFLFVASYIFWPYDLITWQAFTHFICWLLYLVLLVALLIYDWRWMLLPNVLVFPLIGLGAIDVFIHYSVLPNGLITAMVHAVLGALSIGGFYYLLYIISKGHWVGFGDVKLGLFMGIVLGWQQGLVALFLANIVGCLIMLPGLVSKKVSLQSRVPFGPFLIIGFILSGLFGQRLITWYLSLIHG